MLPPGFDVLDVGASKGAGSINFLSQALESEFGKHQATGYHPRTLGVDIDPNKVAICRKAGKECLEGNILELTSGDNSVGGVTAWHVLEHMPSCQVAEKIWIRTSQLADRFSLFHGPAFDDAHVLLDKGFHRFYEVSTGTAEVFACMLLFCCVYFISLLVGESHPELL
jgi:Methylase involved in ubiquinone/menaquinone biosynthesis